MPDAAVTIIGGGVIGLALAAELSAHYSPLLLLERNEKTGMETSSRNSEVIHAGIYYPSGSLKARLCVEGNRRLYDLCSKYDIPHRRITKVITATVPSEMEGLDRVFALGTSNGAALTMVTAAEVKALEPNIVTAGGIFSPDTGIISAHGLMDYYAHAARLKNAQIQNRCEVVGIEKRTTDYRLTLKEPSGVSTVTTEWVINAAGLEADTVAALAGIDVDAAGYRLHYCKGCYFALPGSMAKCISRLVYPAPTTDSLGVHAVLDLAGRLRFGPDVEYLHGRVFDYRVDERRRGAFGASVRRILPFVKDEDLTPDMSGMRPKLQAAGEPPRDFVIKEESERGLPGFIDLIGMDSPGLTASAAIAAEVAAVMRER